MFCEKYNETMCANNANGEGCNGTEECKPGENEKGNLCYVLWQNSSNSLTIKLKGNFGLLPVKTFFSFENSLKEN